MSSPNVSSTLFLLTHPYQRLQPVTGGRKQLKAEGRRPGSALVWAMGRGVYEHDVAVVNRRPGGLALLAVLPGSRGLPGDGTLVRLLDSVRPNAILPHQAGLDAGDLVSTLRQPPEDLGTEVTDYVAWRGIPMDRETSHLVRRTVTLSADLRSVAALSRSLYLSRRALGRRFMARGLPVPSHWLHFARLLRVAIRLQSSEESVLSVGYELGYPDAFSLSNQMVRLTGYRPSHVRRYLGWEWLLEAWLRQEADTGGLAPELTVELLSSAGEADVRFRNRSRTAIRTREERRRREVVG